MLHSIDNSKVRQGLLKVVEMQARLVSALCLPTTQAADVSATWLHDAWKGIDAGLGLSFARSFAGQRNGPRSAAMKAMAAASAADKDEMLELWKCQAAFANLYGTDARHVIQAIDDSREPFASMSALLIAFYEEWLKPSTGFPFKDGLLTRSTINEAFHPLRVCPYCDGTVRISQLDHVLPKSAFPCLSCHPDNLVPVCSGCNCLQVKGDETPLTLANPEAALDWFHPYLRSGDKTVQALVVKNADRTLSLTLTASTPENQGRAAKLDGLLSLSTFWGKDLAGDIRMLPERVRRELKGQPVSLSNLGDVILDKSLEAGHWRGSDALSIYQEGLYRFAARDNDVLQDIILQMEEDGNAQRQNSELSKSAHS